MGKIGKEGYVWTRVYLSMMLISRLLVRNLFPKTRNLFRLKIDLLFQMSQIILMKQMNSLPFVKETSSIPF